MDPEQGTKLTYMVSILAGLIRDGELERRIEALEQALEAQER